MAAITGPASSSLMISLSFKPACVLRSTRPAKTTPKIKRERQGRAVVGDFGHLGQVVRKDLEFLKTGIGRGIEWANKAFRIPEVSKAVDDVVWLRNLEDPDAPPSPAPSWPQPAYPGEVPSSYVYVNFENFLLEVREICKNKTLLQIFKCGAKQR